MYSEAVRLLPIVHYQQPNRLLYIAFSLFLGVVEDDMKDSSGSASHPCLLRLHYLVRRAGKETSAQAFHYFSHVARAV